MQNAKYGNKGWDSLWKKLEQEGNVGIDYCINPYLYPAITKFLKTKPQSTVIDFGAGTNILGIQYLFGYKENIVALKLSKGLDEARKNVSLFCGIEGQKSLVVRGKSYLKDLGNPSQIQLVLANLTSGFKIPFENKAIDLAVSRNFLMHLNLQDLEDHFKEVSRILKPDGKYIFAVLNPDYEQWKYRKFSKKTLSNGQKYNYLHGKKGEYGTFYHYFKTRDCYQNLVEKYFFTEDIQQCLPITDQYKNRYSRYYNTKIPMALIYIVKKK